MEKLENKKTTYFLLLLVASSIFGCGFREVNECIKVQSASNTSTAASMSSASASSAPSTEVLSRTSQLPSTDQISNFKSCSELNAYIDSIPRYQYDDVIGYRVGSGKVCHKKIEFSFFPDSPFSSGPAGSEEPANSQDNAAPVNSNPDQQHYTDQVAGILEGDIVQTSPDYFYFLRAGSVEIINRLSLTKIHSIPIGSNFTFQRIIYHNGKLIFVGSKSMDYGSESTIKVYDEFQAKFDLVLENKVDGQIVDMRINGESLLLLSEAYIAGLQSETDCTNIYRPQFLPTYPVLSRLIKVDLNSNTIISKGFLGKANYMYMTADELILAYNNSPSSLQIISWDNNDILLKQIIPFEGQIKNQSAIYKNNNKIYLATNSTAGGKMQNKILSFAFSNSIKNYQPGATSNAFGFNEELKAITFLGTSAYVVTFAKLDPLYVFALDAKDLQNQDQIKLLTQVESPGFSTQLKILTGNQVAGLGYATEDDFRTTTYKGIKLSLFDLSDRLNPTESAKLEWGIAGTYSEATFNEKALVFEPHSQHIMFPLVIVKKSESNSNWASRNVLDFAGAVILDIANPLLIKTVAQITHREWREKYCNSGFFIPMLAWDHENQSADIQRVFVIDNSIYTFSRFGIKENSAINFQEQNSLEFDNSYSINCSK